MDTTEPSYMRFMDEALQTAAQCWCDEETQDIVMDDRLARAVARRIAVWMDTAASFATSVEYYQGLLNQCGEAIGDAAKTCDDGSRADEVLRAKVPGLVRDLVTRLRDSEANEIRLAREFEQLRAQPAPNVSEAVTLLMALQVRAADERIGPAEFDPALDLLEPV